MTKLGFALALTVAASVLLPRPARADGGTNQNAVTLVLGFAALDLGLATADILIAARHRPAPSGYGGFETVASGAQLAVCLYLAATNQPKGTSAIWGAEAMVSSLLLLHGITTWVASPQGPVEPARPKAAATVAPVAFNDAGRASVPGLAVLGRF